MERIQGFEFKQETTEYNVVLPDQTGTSSAQYANYFGISIPDDYVGANAGERLYYKYWVNTTVKAPAELKSATTLVRQAMMQMKNITVGSQGTIIIQVGTIDTSTNEFTKSDVYKFNVTRQASLHGLTVKAGEANLSLSPTADWVNNPYVWDYSVSSTAEEITLTLKGSEGAKFYVGEQEVAASTDVVVNLSAYRDAPDADVAVVPITVKVESATAPSETTYNLFVSKPDHTPEIKEQPRSVTVNKLENAALSVEVEPKKEGTLTYQWYEKLPYSLREIPGATESVYSAPTTYAGTREYLCIVTNTVGNAPFTATSDTVSVTVNLNVLTAPQFFRPIAIFGNNGSNVFFQSGKPTFAVYVASGKDAADQAEGLNYTVSIYRTSKKEAVGGELQASTTISGASESGGNIYYVELPSQNVAGTWYYYAVVTESKDGFEDAHRASNVAALTFKSAEDIVTELEGTGSADDPYLIYDQSDLEYVKGLVEGKNGTPFNFAGQSLAFANDIELDKTWTPIGNLKSGGDENDRGPSLQPFCGTIDGRNFTLKIADHGKCLLYYVRNATVKNLNIQGDHIDGYGLVERYIVDYGEDGEYIGQNAAKHRTIDIENVTLKSGTKTLQSGFIGGVASGANAVNIRNCTIEKGVIIGYDKSQSYIGSFAGNFNGTIENSVSYATVNGENSVGGLVGQKGQSMGACDFLNCAFLGEIVATGDAVGGIIGSGYSGAPGTPMAQVHNCYVAANITGRDRVGGIVGAEPAHVGNVDEGDQYGVKGTTSITDNHYYGKITASGSNVGGIIGLLYDFTKKTGVATNYFVDDCGASDSIGGVYSGVVVGAERFGIACTPAAFADGTVTARLNTSESGFSYKNWQQGTQYPVFSDKAVAMTLIASGSYKTTFYIGDELDLTGITLTARWSDGTTTPVALDDPALKITGYDSSKRGQQTVTLSYGAATAQVTVTVLRAAGKDITVTFSLLGDTAHGEAGEKHTLAGGNLTKWIDGEKITVGNNATVLDVITKALGEKYSIRNASGNYIQGITPAGKTELAEFTNGSFSGWMYTLNGVHGDLGVAEQYLDEGDVIVFHYTDDYTKEDGSAAGIKTPAEVIVMIDAIGAVDATKRAAISAARLAYDTLSEAEKAQVTNYQKLVDAETAYAKLVAEKGTEIDSIYASVGDSLQAQANKSAPMVGSIGGEWLVIDLARSGRTVPAGYYDNVVAYVKTKADANERLDRSKSTDNSRVILALTAIGKDVTNVGGHNLLKGLDNMAYIQKQGINGPIWALIALDSHEYPTSGDVTREKLVQVILDGRMGDGWSMDAKKVDVDMTAMAIQALAPYYKTNEAVKAAVDKALEWLSGQQQADGGFVSWDAANSESCAQVVVALTALGIDPTKDDRFIKNGVTTLDNLCSYSAQDAALGKGFAHAGTEYNQMATEQAYYALAAYYRLVNKQTSLYDMSDVCIGHKFGDWTVVKEATCTEDGSRTRTCSVCGAVETETIKALGHSLTAVAAKAATCTEPGNRAHWDCARCGKSFSDAAAKTEIAKDSWGIAALGHDEATRAAVAATCYASGRTAETYCKRCGLVIDAGTVIPATGKHTYENGVCSTCGVKNPLADVKGDTIKVDSKNDKTAAGGGLVIKADGTITDDVLADIKAAVSSGAITVTVEDTLQPTNEQKAADGGKSALTEAAKKTTGDAKQELTKLAEKLDALRGDKSRKNAQLEKVVDVTVALVKTEGREIKTVAQLIELPHSVTVTIPITDELYAALQGKRVCVVRSHTDVNGNVTTAELPATLGGTKGNYVLTFQTDKASAFAIVSYETVSSGYYYGGSGTADSGKKDSAKTADDSQMVVWLGSAVLAMAGVVVLSRKKRAAK